MYFSERKKNLLEVVLLLVKFYIVDAVTPSLTPRVAKKHFVRTVANLRKISIKTRDGNMNMSHVLKV